MMETTVIARELRLVSSFHECCPGPAEQGIPETGFECFPSVVTNHPSVPSFIMK